MSFAADVKTELCSVNEKAICCKRAELAAMLLFGGSIADNILTVRTERTDIFKRICSLLKKVLGYGKIQNEPEICVPVELFDELGMFFDEGEAAIDEEVFDSECCKRAFFRGAFLMAGTVSDPKKNYRMELFAYNEIVAALASEMLESFGLLPKSTERKNYFIIYLEDYESVCDGLTIMGAPMSMMEMTYTQIEKDISNRKNRQGNCFAANLDKTYTASARHCAAIDELAKTGRLETLDDGLKTVAYARAENPEMTLKELGEVVGISKSTLNRRLNRLVELAEEK